MAMKDPFQEFEDVAAEDLSSQQTAPVPEGADLAPEGPESGPAPAPEPEAAPQSDGVQDRIREQADRLARLEQRNEDLMQLLLRYEEKAEAGPETTSTEPIDEDVRKLVAPIIKEEIAPLRRMAEEVAELRQAHEYDQAFDSLEQAVPGFTESWLPLVINEWSQMDPQTQRLYDSPQGALAIMGLLSAQGRGPQTPTPTPNPLRNRARLEGPGGPITPQAPSSDDGTGVWRMSHEEFQQHLARLRGLG